MIEVLVFFLAIAAIVGALILLRRAQVRRYDRESEQMDDQLGNEIPPWDKGEEYREPQPPLRSGVDHVNG